MTIDTVGVLGAGVMGSTVAQLLAQHAFQIILVDVSDRALECAKGEIERGIRLQRLLGSGETLPHASAVLANITFTTDEYALHAIDFLVENVTEQWDIKRDIYPRIDRISPPECIFAVNTSVIPITQLAALTQRPTRVIGVHFMNPVTIIPMVEVIRGFHTSEQSVEVTLNLLRRVGKEAVIVRDSPGFVSNRVLMLTINEAIFLCQEGVSTPEDIDRLFKGCFGHKMGPLETADLIGLDTILYSIEELWSSFADSKYRPCPLLRTMVTAGLLGRKSGRGFYSYQPGGLTTTQRDVSVL